MPRTSLTFTPLILLLTVFSAPTRAQDALSAALVKGDKVRTSHTVRNRCTAPRVFRLDENPDVSWFRFVGERTVTVAPNEEKELEVEFDSTGLKVGTYSGQVVLTCLDCASEPGCFTRNPTHPVLLKVIWSGTEFGGMAGEYVEGQILVSLGTGSPTETRRLARQLERKYQLKRLKIIRLRSISQTAVLFSALNPRDSVPLLVQRLSQDHAVYAAQPNFIYTGFGAQQEGNYEIGSLQHGPRQINAHLAQRHSTGRRVRVALLDTWVDRRHRDLRGKIVENKNFTDDARHRQDTHGTIMAGIIVAIPGNKFGIAGVAPDAQIISVKVLKQGPKAEETWGTSADIVDGMEYAIWTRADVINMSFGDTNDDPKISTHVQEAYRRGIVLVAAAGNDGPLGNLVYPAALEEVIAVSAVDDNGSFFAKGTQGDYIDVAAPGVGILSARPGGSFNYSDGTSEAAAHVTGVVALLLARAPAASPAKIKKVLEAHSRDLGPQGRDDLFGSGLVDACRSLEALIGGRLCS